MEISMSLLDLFKSREKRARLSHLKALVALSMADGVVQKSELAAIAMICDREGISEEELRRCLGNPDSISFVAPKDLETRIKYLKDMVFLMMCDGDMDDNEMRICRLTAEALGFRKEVIEALILDICVDVSQAINDSLDD